MTDYYGTDEDDIIDASQFEDGQFINIYPGKGNDEVINATYLHTIVNGEGEEILYQGSILIMLYGTPKKV